MSMNSDNSEQDQWAWAVSMNGVGEAVEFDKQSMD